MSDTPMSVLRDAEKRLRAMSADLINAGQYEESTEVIGWARRLAKLIASSTSDEPKLGSSLRHELRTKSRNPSKTIRKDEPRFIHIGGFLTRVSWSKRDGREYEHRISTQSLRAVANALIRACKDGRIATTKQIAQELRVDTRIPDYQIYVALGFLLHAELVDQHGRRGYSIPKPDTFLYDADVALEQTKQ
jgi:hypothetical protein